MIWLVNNLSAIVVFIFGASVGSFLNVVIWRLPQGKPLGGRSACPHCQNQLQTRDLAPLLSFLWLRAKCRNCKVKISWRYFVIEFICAALFLAAWQDLRPENLVQYVELLRLFAALSLLIVVFAIDLEHYLILDSVLLWGGGAVFLAGAAVDVLSGRNLSINSLSLGGFAAGLSAAAVFYLLWLISRGRWMGLGDVKFVFILGLILGWPNIWLALWLAFVSGAAAGVALLAVGKKSLKSPLPFGTFLSLAAVLAIFYGPAIWQWYWGFGA